MNEYMKPILTNTDYSATKSGKIWSNKRGKFLAPTKKKNGYLQVNLWKNGVMETHTVHRLVYEAFNGEIPYGMQVNHINENKTDNNLENLNLMNAKENCNHGSRLERIARNRGNTVILHGVKCGGRYYFNSHTEAAKHFDIARQTFTEKVGLMRNKGSNRIKVNRVEYIVKEA